MRSVTSETNAKAGGSMSNTCRRGAPRATSASNRIIEYENRDRHRYRDYLQYVKGCGQHAETERIKPNFESALVRFSPGGKQMSVPTTATEKNRAGAEMRSIMIHHSCLEDDDDDPSREEPKYAKRLKKLFCYCFHRIRQAKRKTIGCAT